MHTEKLLVSYGGKMIKTLSIKAEYKEYEKLNFRNCICTNNSETGEQSPLTL